MKGDTIFYLNGIKNIIEVSMILSFFFRLLNKFASFSFRSYARKHCNYCGSNCYVAYNWSLVNPECILIGENFSANSNLRLQCWLDYNHHTTGYTPELIIGDNVSMISNCQVSCMNRIEIESGCLLGDNVFITDNFHGNTGNSSELDIPPALRMLSSKGPVIIGKNCWLGRNVCVMPGVSIGDGCIIGANAVVTNDIPGFSVAVGVPAKVIKSLH